MDDARVPTREKAQVQGNYGRGTPTPIAAAPSGGKEYPVNLGRFPANLLVSDDALNDGRVSKGQSGAVSGKEPSFQQRGNTYGDYSGFGKASEPRGDYGSFSRYFDLDQWAGKNLPKEVQKVFPFLIVPKAAKSEKNKGLDNMPDVLGGMRSETSGQHITRRDGGDPKFTKNHHPTVKPIKLMSYLITLGSRPGDVVLDPFLGSGTTALAAKLLNRDYIGIELEREYAEIAQARIKTIEKQQKLL